MDDGIAVYVAGATTAWTVGDLRAEIADLADDVRLRVCSTEEPGDEFLVERVVVGADRAICPGPVDDVTPDHEELQLLCDFPPPD